MSTQSTSTSNAAITVTANNLLTPTDSSCEMNIALTLSRALPEEYAGGEMINLMSGIGVSPEYHRMVEELVSGKLILRDFATYIYMAGRLSLALATQQ